MVPQSLREIDALPLTPNGKVDRSALPPLFDAAAAKTAPSVPPRSDAEARVAQIWSEVLGIAEIGVFDDFFTIGGDSMLAIKLLAMLRHRQIEATAAGFHPGQ